jgi:hypothetical protein
VSFIIIERFNLKKLNKIEGEISDRFAALENLETMMWILIQLGKLLEKYKISSKESLGYYELKKHKPQFDKGYSTLLDQRKQAKL